MSFPYEVPRFIKVLEESTYSIMERIDSHITHFALFNDEKVDQAKESDIKVAKRPGT